VHYIEQDSLANLTLAEREEVTPILTAKVDEPAIDWGAGRDVVKDWKLIDFVFSLDKVGKGRNLERGKRMFQVARCSACHKVGDEGKAFGPDLTDVAKRFNRRDLLVSILSPSTVIADKYRGVRFVMTDGKPSDTMVFEEQCAAIKRAGFAAVVGCAAGPKADPKLLQRFCTQTAALDTLDGPGFERFFTWVSDVIADGSRSQGVGAPSSDLPPPPDEIKIAL